VSDNFQVRIAVFDPPTENTCWRNYDEGARCGRPKGHEGQCSQVSRWVPKENQIMSSVTVHWMFKEEPTRVERQLCTSPRAARDADHSIVLRPVIRQKPGGRLRECVRCAAIGKALEIP
jgi:hypothetical protein